MKKRLIVRDMENGDIVFKSKFYDDDLEINELDLFNSARNAMREYHEACDGEWIPECYWLSKTYIDIEY